MPRKITLLLLALAFLTLSAPRGEAQSRSQSDSLTRVIRAADSTLFAAFNACDTTALANGFARDIEFFHDKTGLTIGRDANAGLIAARCRDVAAGRSQPLRRTLLPATLQVYPVPGYGAMEIGHHLFQHVEGHDTITADFGFSMVWRRTTSGWEVTRILSYGH